MLLPGAQNRLGKDEGDFVLPIAWSLIVGEKYWYKAFVTMAFLSITFFLKPILLRFISAIKPVLSNVKSWRLSFLGAFYVIVPSLLYFPVSYAFRIKNPGSELEERVMVPLSAFFVYGWPFFLALVYSLFSRIKQPRQDAILGYAKSFLAVIFSFVIVCFLPLVIETIFSSIIPFLILIEEQLRLLLVIWPVVAAKIMTK